MDDLAAFAIDWALVEAAHNHRWSKVKRIILRGGNANTQDCTKDCDCDLAILELAVVAGEIEMVHWLVDTIDGGSLHVEKINAVRKDERTAVHPAVKKSIYINKDKTQQQNHQLEICNCLLANRADMRLKPTIAGESPLDMAYSQQENDDAISYMMTWLPMQPDCSRLLVNEQNKAGKTPLSLVVRLSSAETTMIELYRGDVLLEAADCTTPLHQIIRQGKRNVFQWLVQTNQINCDYADKWGRSLMHIAASSSDDTIRNKESGTGTGTGLDILNWLINNGFSSQVSSRDVNGKTPLHVASSVHAAALLVERAGADIHARTKTTGATPLHSALCTKCSQEMIQWLVVYGGADVNARDNHGRTPLHVAIDVEDVKATEWLIQHGGADWTIRDDDGRSPLDAALLDCDDSMLCWGYHSPIVEILQQELLERYLEIQTLARKGAFSCPMRRLIMIGLIS